MLHTDGLALVVLIMGCMMSTASAMDLPSFSWATVPIYQQLCSVNATSREPFEQARMEWLADKYPVVVLEHCQGMGPQVYEGTYGPAPYVPAKGYIEDQFWLAAAAIKKVNPSVRVYNYQNVHAALPYYRFTTPISQHPEYIMPYTKKCRSSGGHMFPLLSTYVWNTSNPNVVEIWKAQFANLTSDESPIDGTYVDTATSCGDTGAENLIGAVQSSRPDKVLGYNTEQVDTGAKMVQTYSFSANQRYLDWLNKTAANDLITLAHAQVYLTTTGKATFNSSLATFLIGASEYQYFAFSGSPGGPTSAGPGFCDPRGQTAPEYPTWCTGMGWADEFSRPLGKPLGPAVPNADGTLFRKFESGTTVKLNLEDVSCSINWADGGPATICS